MRRTMERTMERNAEKEYNYKPVGIVGEGPQRGRREGSYGNSQYKATGWEPTCQCNAAVVPCTVLDPFGGSGTTGVVAKYLERNAILIEMNPEYVEMAERRIAAPVKPKDIPLIQKESPLLRFFKPKTLPVGSLANAA